MGSTGSSLRPVKGAPSPARWRRIRVSRKYWSASAWASGLWPRTATAWAKAVLIAASSAGWTHLRTGTTSPAARAAWASGMTGPLRVSQCAKAEPAARAAARTNPAWSVENFIGASFILVLRYQNKPEAQVERRKRFRAIQRQGREWGRKPTTDGPDHADVPPIRAIGEIRGGSEAVFLGCRPGNLRRLRSGCALCVFCEERILLRCGFPARFTRGARVRQGFGGQASPRGAGIRSGRRRRARAVLRRAGGSCRRFSRGTSGRRRP